MEVVDIPVHLLKTAEWNPNRLSAGMEEKLENSLRRYGVVQNLVVRRAGDRYEILGGNHRYRLLKNSGAPTAPCVVVDVGDGDARLLAQALNRLHGEDNAGLKSRVVREILDSMDAEEALSILPESASSLKELGNLGQEDIAEHLRQWELMRKVKLTNLILAFSDDQMEVVEEAIERARPLARQTGGAGSTRSRSIYQICRRYIEEEEMP